MDDATHPLIIIPQNYWRPEQQFKRFGRQLCNVSLEFREPQTSLCVLFRINERQIREKDTEVIFISGTDR